MESFSTQIMIFMRDSGLMTWPMAGESIYMLMELYSKVHGLMTSSMDME
jgi:hypothetical protein